MIAIATDDTVNNVITTVLTVTSFIGLDGTDILCVDVSTSEIQETIARVFSKLSPVQTVWCASGGTVGTQCHTHVQQWLGDWLCRHGKEKIPE
jgi:bacterioferritin-associated ferredoxin